MAKKKSTVARFVEILNTATVPEKELFRELLREKAPKKSKSKDATKVEG